MSLLDLPAQAVSIEYAWVGVADAKAQTMVFLHEGLGSVSMWRDFPERLCSSLGLRGLVYSRPGYGRSTPRPKGERWSSNFMHQQAHRVLPALLEALELDGPSKPWLFGHSDGASIALLFAGHDVHAARGVIALAPHVMVEDITVRSIAAAAKAYREGELRGRLARHHADVDSAFWGWCDAWLDPGFLHWNIEADLAGIRCPLLLVQGKDDEYGTLEQLRRIETRVPHAQALELQACRHSPHRDQADAVIGAVGRFLGHGVRPDAAVS